MTTRLDRLFLLLDQGSSSVTRKAAALQLGEVQKLHPHELKNLLSKVRTFLHSNSWDTRIAASQAVEAIITNVEPWYPEGIKSEISKNADDDTSLKADGRMIFANFDINTVIEHGKDLLGSEGSEYDTKAPSNDVAECDTKEKIAAQRRLLNQRLGLDVAERLNLGITSDEMISNEDLAESALKSKDLKKDINEVYHEVTNTKRRNGGNFAVNGNLPKKKIKIEHDDANNGDDKIIDFNDLHEWPLQSFSDELMSDLFNSAWEVRHGAATAIREVVKQHGKCGGRTIDAPTSQLDKLNQLWLEDLTLRLVCVIALDKFGDFVSDQVVAPVRETCAQAIGSVFNIMSDDGVLSTMRILLNLLDRPEWEARHGALLSLKYLFAIRQDMASHILPIVFQPIFSRLQDHVDDVSAVAAAALVPIKDALIETLPEKVSQVVNYLWDALLEIDDLTSSTSNILILLSSLLSFDNKSADKKRLKELVPRLWPFLSHNLSLVRRSVLDAFLMLLKTSPEVNTVDWLDEDILKSALSLIYQRSLIETNESILESLYDCWEQIVSKSQQDLLFNTTAQLITGWICLMMHPAKLHIDTKASPVWITVHHKSLAVDEIHSGNEKYYLGGSESLGENASVREKCVFRARIQASRCIGLLAYHITKPIEDVSPTPLECFENIMLFHLNSKSSTQRTCIGLIVIEWAGNHVKMSGKENLESFAPKAVIERCLQCLEEFVFYDEIGSLFSKLQYESRDFVTALKQNKFVLDESVYKPGAIYTFDQINELGSQIYPNLSSQLKLKPKVQDNLDERKTEMLRLVQEVMKNQTVLSTATLASLACALLSWDYMPEKLNPVIRPLMESIKKEETPSMQKLSAVHIVRLLGLCCDKLPEGRPSPVAKVVKNIISFVCCDQNYTPPLRPSSNSSSQSNLHRSSSSSSLTSLPSTPTTPNFSDGIISLSKMQKQSEKQTQFRRSNSVNNAKKASQSVSEFPTSEESPGDNDEQNKANTMMRLGASQAIVQLSKHFGKSLVTKIPSLWDTMYTYVVENCTKEDEVTAQNMINSLQLLEIVSLHLDQDLHHHLEALFEPLCSCLENPFSSVRHMAARCFGAFSVVATHTTMDCVLNRVLGTLGASDSDIRRQGAVEAISCVAEKLGIRILPYVVFLIVPMLGRMSDQNEHVRLLATHCFAQLVQIMPLDTGTNNDVKFSPEMIQRKKEEQRFIEQLLNVKNIDNYQLPIQVKAELRCYQQDGVNWLAFLNRYKLHGILCDEMGLGKTLMSICILASDHHDRAQRFLQSKSPDSKPLPSLVVCPPTLTGHWAYEVEKFVDKVQLHALHYTGSPSERNKLREKVKKQNGKCPYNLVVASYDIVRNDVDFFGSINWNYLILDEGHIIKNGKTKLSKAIKSLSANHRLILTGTPIQNNVLELWSLFDFLMPGFLGSERQFMTKFSRPILASRDAKASSKEQEAGVLAMESLHRQVLPFILRRMKEDVLKDLPPKIIQDYYCDLSPLQSQLYEDFAKSRARKTLEDKLGHEPEVAQKENAAANPVTSHIFQALQYLRKVCNHPKLVLNPQHPEYEPITKQLSQQNSNLSDISHAAKLVALKQLLLDCGIGMQSQNSLTNYNQPVVNQHRALIFCQLKSMLDIVETDLLKTHMPSVTYMRLDGSVAPGSRHTVVHRFNNDPSIDVLLLTTQVGGLGLNLTGADTVIFVEHDWNPMKDLQAMDRAHRIGQKKVVNVYRLVTTGTLEEKIMGLQKFKITIANTVISQDNSSLQTMGTDQLLDLFTFDPNSKHEQSEPKSVQKEGMKAILENLPELWDSEQYDAEYDLSSFVKSLRT
ncbi:TATA-binding protein-associated factor [Halotydeus destructor]|nr:TATA-binding protein-associated factor [Halotydeus destructor]